MSTHKLTLSKTINTEKTQAKVIARELEQFIKDNPKLLDNTLNLDQFINIYNNYIKLYPKNSQKIEDKESLYYAYFLYALYKNKALCHVDEIYQQEIKIKVFDILSYYLDSKHNGIPTCNKMRLNAI